MEFWIPDVSWGREKWQKWSARKFERGKTWAREGDMSMRFPPPGKSTTVCDDTEKMSLLMILSILFNSFYDNVLALLGEANSSSI